MSPEMIDITDMICRVFRLAETSWKKSPAETSAIFKKYDILGFITECFFTTPAIWRLETSISNTAGVGLISGADFTQPPPINKPND